MRVVIVGAGLSGLSLAAFLRRLNISAVVIDQQPYLHANFQLPVVLWANGLSCYRAFGVDDFFAPGNAEPEMSFGFANRNLEWLLRIQNRQVQLDPYREHDRIPSTNAPTATSHTLVSRVVREHELIDAATVPLRTTISARRVKNALRKWVPEMRLGQRVVDLVPHAGGKGGVHVVMEDGSEEWGDVVVGADGMHSTVRRLIYPNEECLQTTSSLNMTQIDGFVDVDVLPEGLPDAPCELLGTQRSLSFFPLHHHGERRVAFCATMYKSPEEVVAAASEADPVALRNIYRSVAAKEFSEFGDAVRHLLADATLAVPTEALEVPIMPQWHHRRAVLLGEAAHGSFPSFLAHDASLCVEDASMLATLLAQVPFMRDRGFEHVFRVYEAVRRKRVERYIRQSRRARRFTATPFPAARDVALRATPPPLAAYTQKWLVDWAYSHKIAVTPVDIQERGDDD